MKKSDTPPANQSADAQITSNAMLHGPHPHGTPPHAPPPHAHPPHPVASHPGFPGSLHPGSRVSPRPTYPPHMGPADTPALHKLSEYARPHAALGKQAPPAPSPHPPPAAAAAVAAAAAHAQLRGKIVTPVLSQQWWPTASNKQYK